jgi:hypothetical protein
VPRQNPQVTANLLESLLTNPDVKVGEANQIVKMSRTPRRTVRGPLGNADNLADTPTAPQPTPQDPTPAPKDPEPAPTPAPAPAPLPVCKPLQNTDSVDITKVSEPKNWGLDRLASREASFVKEYKYADAGAHANVFIVDTGVQVGLLACLLAC